jgi:hypothetical protein
MRPFGAIRVHSCSFVAEILNFYFREDLCLQ